MNGDVNKLCLNCMQYTLEGGNFCKACGAPAAPAPALPHHLAPRTVLNGKYLAARVLGEGGFGITYLGWDINLEVRVAIKEYYPLGAVTRNTTIDDRVSAIGGSTLEFFDQGRERFIDEARRLARFYSLPGIVSVKDFFLENGTAYIVMEFVEGVTLKDHLDQNGGRMPEGTVLALMEPLMRSLSQVHKAGVIHRDISPDNIMLGPDGALRLIDFGAARDFGDDNKSLSVLLKPGYAPEEQYRTRGRQGPWTDIYALSATIFRAIEGNKPPESMERMFEDTFAGFTLPVSETTRAALMRGLAVRSSDRWQSLEELHAALYPHMGPAATPVAPMAAQPPMAPPLPSTPPTPSVQMPSRSNTHSTSGQPGPPTGQPPPPWTGGAAAAPAKPKTNLAPVIIVAVVVLLLIVALVVGLSNPGGQGSTSGGAAGEPGDFVVTAKGQNGEGSYDGMMEDGLADGFGEWTYGNFLYSGLWERGKPNGSGVVTETIEPPENPDPDTSYALRVVYDATFVDGIVQGLIHLQWEMSGGETHHWEVEVVDGRPPRAATIQGEYGGPTLDVDPTNLFAVPPWDAEAPAPAGAALLGEVTPEGYRVSVDIIDDTNAVFRLTDPDIQESYEMNVSDPDHLDYGWSISFGQDSIFDVALLHFSNGNPETFATLDMQSDFWLQGQNMGQVPVALEGDTLVWTVSVPIGVLDQYPDFSFYNLTEYSMMVHRPDFDWYENFILPGSAASQPAGQAAGQALAITTTHIYLPFDTASAEETEKAAAQMDAYHSELSVVIASGEDAGLYMQAVTEENGYSFSDCPYGQYYAFETSTSGPYETTASTLAVGEVSHPLIVEGAYYIILRLE